MAVERTFAEETVLAGVLVANDEAAKPAKARVITAARTKVFFMGSSCGARRVGLWDVPTWLQHKGNVEAKSIGLIGIHMYYLVMITKVMLTSRVHSYGLRLRVGWFGWVDFELSGSVRGRGSVSLKR